VSDSVRTINDLAEATWNAEYKAAWDRAVAKDDPYHGWETNDYLRAILVELKALASKVDGRDEP